MDERYGGAVGTNNLWRWTWEDKEGFTETAESRGPTSEDEMRQAAEQILSAMRRKAIASGAADPGLRIIDIQPAGYDQISPVGMFQPIGARPLDIDRYAAPARENA